MQYGEHRYPTPILSPEYGEYRKKTLLVREFVNFMIVPKCIPKKNRRKNVDFTDYEGLGWLREEAECYESPLIISLARRLCIAND